MLRAFLWSPSVATMDALRDILEEGQLFDVTTGYDAATALEPLSVTDEYDVFVIHNTPHCLSATAWANVIHAIETGAGALLIDCGGPLDALTTESLAIAQRNALVPETLRFTAHHPITRGLRDFTIEASTANTEPTDRESVLATLQPSDLPALLVSRRARGHVARLALGVDDRALTTSDPVRRLIHRCAEWACSGNVIDF